MSIYTYIYIYSVCVHIYTHTYIHIHTHKYVINKRGRGSQKYKTVSRWLDTPALDVEKFCNQIYIPSTLIEDVKTHT